jgi:hypothetical protein
MKFKKRDYRSVKNLSHIIEESKITLLGYILLHNLVNFIS